MSLTHFPHGLTSFGVPVFGASTGQVPIFGTTYFVDGTNGADGNTGLEPDRAFKTIQKAITVQIANTTGLGDVIYVLPGNYAESLTGNLTNVSLIGVHPFTVRVQPTSGHAYSGDIVNSKISGICWDSASTSDTAYAAVRTSVMTDSIIEGCQFCCKVSAANTTAFRCGTEATGSGNVDFFRSIFRNNWIMSNGAGQVFEYGFVIGSGAGDLTNGTYRAMWNSVIEGNHICAEKQGIRLNLHYCSGYGCYIERNVIGGDSANHGETEEQGIYFYDDHATGKTSLGTWVIGNYVSSDSDAISGFDVQLVHGNIVAVGGVGTGTPADELW